MVQQISKIFVLLLVVGWLVLPLNSAQAVLVTEPGGVIMVDGNGDGVVNPFAIELTIGVNSTPFDFGFVEGGVFTSILSIPAITGPFGFGSATVSGTAEFDAGDIVDFALSNGTDVFSISNAITDFGDLDFDLPVSGGTPDPNVSSYFNSLTIDWNEGNVGLGIPGLFFTSTFLNAGGNQDGFAPVPIPPSVLLFGTGLIGLIGIARRSLFAK